MTEAEENSTRVGSQAMFIYACVSTLFTIILPKLVCPRLPHINYSERHKRGCGSADVLTLPRLWCLSQAIFLLAMLGSLIISTTAGATVLIGIMGISWSCTTWIPYALVGNVVSEADLDKDLDSADESRHGLAVGLHSVSMAAPQLIAAMLCTLTFYALENSESSVVYVLSAGSLSGFISAYCTTYLE